MITHPLCLTEDEKGWFSVELFPITEYNTLNSSYIQTKLNKCRLWCKATLEPGSWKIKGRSVFDLEVLFKNEEDLLAFKLYLGI